MHLAQFLVHLCYEYYLSCFFLVSRFFFFEGEFFIVPLIVRMFPRRPVKYFAGY